MKHILLCSLLCVSTTFAGDFSFNIPVTSLALEAKSAIEAHYAGGPLKLILDEVDVQIEGTLKNPNKFFVLKFIDLSSAEPKKTCVYYTTYFAVLAMDENSQFQIGEGGHTDCTDGSTRVDLLQ